MESSTHGKMDMYLANFMGVVFLMVYSNLNMEHTFYPPDIYLYIDRGILIKLMDVSLELFCFVLEKKMVGNVLLQLWN